MDILTIAIPCYNSEQYMEKCIDTILDAGKHIEIIIVNDGSTDRTGAIADSYVKEYPGRVKAIHQRNKGHGGAVNAGIKAAQGLYYKVVDSDDWVDSKVLKNVVETLISLETSHKPVDMFITDFVYDKVDAKHKKIMDYKNVIPEGKRVSWSEIGQFKRDQYILMHSVIYRMEVLRKCGLSLPEKTFYVDNLFVYCPLPYVNHVFYLHQCLYHYFIGREDQSVNEDVMIKRIDQQLRVNRLMMEQVDLKKVNDRKKQRYMTHFLGIVTTVSSALLIKKGTQEAYEMKKALWRSVFEYNVPIYMRLRMTLAGSIINCPGRMGRLLTMVAYKRTQKKIGFN